jgi:hypothetical protein
MDHGWKWCALRGPRASHRRRAGMGLRPQLLGGRLDKGLGEAQASGWTLVDMKNDWKTIFPFGSK